MSIQENTPVICTGRLLLRKFTREDLPALFRIYSDPEVNTFLPWFPLRNQEEAGELFEEQYAKEYRNPRGYRYAVCLKEDGIPVGYVHVSMDDSYDLGYGLARGFWRRGIITEACGAVIERLKEDKLPYVTATHDVNNPASGNVMKRLGMKYRYSYEEQWQPKNIPVIFRMYQMNLDGEEDRVYRKYWELHERHFVEEI